MTVYPRIVDGDPKGGSITFIYEYSGLINPVVDWELTNQKALKQCEAWGFQKVEFFEGGKLECISQGEYSCDIWRVTHKCLCLMNP